ncbi:hypothetical protein NQ318_014691 [Aromia moschata]|uniref:Phenoloxidase-activating factor 2 n=1 Tax=Aromia moschata TaxID=1265417 RepID=A0AAV8ZCW7_9CUCU|nr:hypothetical protein NQ318_014691 [Aromia moschata]
MRLVLTFVLVGVLGVQYSVHTPGYEEVTSTTEGSRGYVAPCGEGDDRGKRLCVPYYQCDGRTKTIVQTGVTDGFGVIDIRFGENQCSHPLDVCCNIPEGGLDPKLPQPGQPITTTTTERAPDGERPTPAPIASCGIRNNNGIDFKISGNRDNEAEYGEFPWMVALLKRDYNPAVDKTLAFCGGSLITPTVVLTGAHCVAKSKTTDIKVRIGEWDTQTTKERLPYQERNVVNIITHPNFNPGTVVNDFALLILDEPVVQAENVGTICLPAQGQVVNSANCFVSGWGKDIFGKIGTYQVILKKIELPIVPPPQCQDALRKTRLGAHYKLDKSFICAGGEEGKDACTGDGGSPLVCPDPQNPTRYVQAGIVAWGIGCGQSNVPGVYADVAKFRSWIDDQLLRLSIDTRPYIVVHHFIDVVRLSEPIF